MSGLKILHCFADHGIESEVLTAYGETYRVGLDPTDTNDSIPIKANAKSLPFKPNTFDLGLFHPPCAFKSRVTNISGNQSDHENLIPLSRDLGKEYCEHYIIENVPEALKKWPYAGKH